MLKIILILSCAILFGCDRSLPDRSLKEYVSETDVVGKWKLTPESLALLTQFGFKEKPEHKYSIVFHPDGTCEYHTVVGYFEDIAYYEVAGSWELEKDTMGNSNYIKKNALRIEISTPNMDYTRYLNFDKKEGQIILWNYYGDPDSWEFLEYEKIKNNPSAHV